MAVWVSCRLRRFRIRLHPIQRLAKHILRKLGYRQVDVNLTFVGDRLMRDLNHRYRQHDRPTDVLAFAGCEAFQPPSAMPILGDVVVSIPAAMRQAKTAGHTVDRELTLLLVHGLLHLCGYDHARSAREARRMFRKEREILASVADPPQFFQHERMGRGRDGVD